MTPLAEKLQALIVGRGPLPVDVFMTACLLDPDFGYYTGGKIPFGTAGDFITAPEISQVFGELIGAWVADTWSAMGAPARVNLVELGPGRGTLMADILRVAHKVPDFAAAADVWMVEASPSLQEIQKATLGDDAEATRWVDSFAGIPHGPTLLVANEFFDCLPVKQFVSVEMDAGLGWAERLVGIDDEGALAWEHAQSAGPMPKVPWVPAPTRACEIVETSPTACQAAHDIARHIAQHGGAALIIDYGHAGGAAGETLQAIHKHQPADILATAGEADLSVHVDFGAVKAAAEAAGATVLGPIGQGEFLLSLGLTERVEVLHRAEPDPEKRAAIVSGAQRLVGTDGARGGMGALFKAMVIAPKGARAR